LKKSVKILIWSLSGALIVFIIVFVSTKRNNAVCTKITINISDTANLKLLDEKEILIVIEPSGRKIVGRPISEINISGLEKKLNKYLLIKSAETYINIDGEIVADIVPRIPIVKVYNRLNQNYSIDKEGFIMPVSTNNPIRIVVANGNISFKPRFDTIFNIYNKKYNNRLDIKTLRDIHVLASFIHSNPFWEAQVEQIYINTDDEIEISTLVGDQNIIFGSIENYEEKFRNLESFYKKGIPIAGWKAYKEINLKYKNQVVCTKSE
jgi:cell division protein FtsQ